MGKANSINLLESSRGTDTELEALRILDKSWFLDLSYRKAGGNRHLHWACYTGKVKLVRSLLGKGAKCNVLNKDSATPLMVAIRFNHYDVVKAMVELNVDVNFRTQRWGNALTLAVSCNNLDMCKLLLHANADIQTFALSKCAYMMESRDVAKFLLDNGADPNSADDQQGDEETIPLTVLMTAVVYKNMPIIELLTDQSKLNINQKNGDGHTALDFATSLNEKKIIDLLIAKGANTKVTELDESYRRKWLGKLAMEVVQPLGLKNYSVFHVGNEIRDGKSLKRSREASQDKDTSPAQPTKRARASSILRIPVPKQNKTPKTLPLTELADL